MTGPGSATPDQPLRPQAPERRLTVVDALRGFAVLGILLVNSTMFLQPLYTVALGTDWASPLDHAVEDAVQLLAEGKFVTTFSFLFGLGVILQGRRAEGRGEDAGPVAFRRMAGLLVIGIGHVLLLWSGDILVYYALLGVLLVAFYRRAPARRLRRAALVFLALPIVLTLIYAGLFQLDTSTAEGTQADQQLIAQSDAQYRVRAEEARAIFSGSDFGAMVGQRVAEWGFTTSGLLFSGLAFLVFGMFLVGAWAGRVGLFDRVGDHRALLTRLFVAGLLGGVLANGFYLTLDQADLPVPADGRLILEQLSYVVGGPTLCLAYVSGLTLLFSSGRAQAVQRALGAVGRTALSNYILQSLVMTTLAYGYGFGLYGRVGPAGAVGIALVLYTAQVLLSLWWTGRFRFGPLEWLWRWFTYGKRPEMVSAGGS